MLSTMMRVFKDKRYAQKYKEFSYKEDVDVTAGKHGGKNAFVVGETEWKVHVYFPSGRVATLDKCDVCGDHKRALDRASTKVARSTTHAEIVEIIDDTVKTVNTVKTEPSLYSSSTARDLTSKGGLVDSIETDTECALRLLMVCFERQGISPTSTDAYKIFRDFAEAYSTDE